MFFKDEDKIIYDYLSETKKNILFVVGASWPSKIYSKEKFAKIVDKIEANCLITWGNEQERENAILQIIQRQRFFQN